MNKEAPQHSRLDEQSIMEAATAALRDLQLDIEVKEVTAEDDDWCVHFSTEYSRFCDSFHDQFDKENSHEVIREKVKRHILKQQQNKIRTSVRIRRGKTERREESATLFDSAVKAVGEIAAQTADLTGEIINQASRLPDTALKAVDEAAKVASAAISPASTPVQSAQQPLARLTVKRTAPKTTRKSSSSARKASAKKTSGGKASTTRKATSKKQRASAQPAAKAKSTSQSGKKRGGTKKSVKRR